MRGPVLSHLGKSISTKLGKKPGMKGPTFAGRDAPSSRILRVFFMCLAPFVVSLSVSTASAQTKALDVPEKSIVAAPRGERILMMLNLQADREKLRAMSAEDASATLVETGRRYATAVLNDERYRASYSVAEVIFAFVVNMDEYNRPNYGGMVRVGTVSYQREEAGLKVVSTQLDTSTIR